MVSVLVSSVVDGEFEPRRSPFLKNNINHLKTSKMMMTENIDISLCFWVFLRKKN
jgi:hypothetical protein